MKDDLESAMKERIKCYQENSKKNVTPVIQNSIKSWWVKQKELEQSSLGQVQKEVKDYTQVDIKKKVGLTLLNLGDK